MGASGDDDGNGGNDDGDDMIVMVMKIVMEIMFPFTMQLQEVDLSLRPKDSQHFCSVSHPLLFLYNQYVTSQK